jgi:regulator of replication initiation timing
MTNPTDELRRENEQLKQELTRLAQRNAVLVCECDELRERLRQAEHENHTLRTREKRRKERDAKA